MNNRANNRANNTPRNLPVNPVNTETLRVLRDRVLAADPGFIRLRIAAWAVLGIALAAVVMASLHWPLTTILVGAIAAMQSTFTVNDRTPRAQAVTLVLAACSGAFSLTIAAFGTLVPPVDDVLFIVLIFFAVYAQRFAPRGNAIGGLAFFMFFFAMFLRVNPGLLPQFLAAMAVGIASHAIVRFAVLPRRPASELLRVRRAFRARLGTMARAAAAYLAGGNDRRRAALKRADSRLHEAVLMIEEAIGDTLDPPAAESLRRRAIEVELAAQWLAITVLRGSARGMPDDVRNELVVSLLRFDSLIESDPRELPLISDTDEFSHMLVAGSRLGPPSPGDEIRRALAELALADVNAQRIAENDFSAEIEESGESGENEQVTPERKPVFAFDNRTRSAIQATIGGGLAVVGGDLVSPQRWYWAVLTVFVVFLNTSTAGGTLVRGFRRVTGTLVGIFGGMLLALLVTGQPVLTVVLLMLCVFGLVYTLRVSQLVSSFFITCMLGVLYSLLGTFSIEVLWLRVAETFVGALSGLLAAIAVLPVHTRTVLRADLRQVLEDLRSLLTGAEDVLSGRENVNVIELSRKLDRSVEKARTTAEPLTHPISVSSRREYGAYLLTTLDRMTFRARKIAARTEPCLLPADDRLRMVVDRVTGNIDTLIEALETGTTKHKLDRAADTSVLRDSDDAEVRSVLISLDRVDDGIVALGRVFDVPVAEPPKPRRGADSLPGKEVRPAGQATEEPRRERDRGHRQAVPTPGAPTRPDPAE